MAKGSGTVNPDTTPADEHYTSYISLTQSTIGVTVSYDCVYDTHYRLLDPHHWESQSSAVSIKEWRDPKDVSRGFYPEGDDHGFLWRTNTFWFVRENNGGVDVELDSMSLSRPIPTGFAWWGSRRTREAVDKMLRDMKAAVEALHRQAHRKAISTTVISRPPAGGAGRSVRPRGTRCGPPSAAPRAAASALRRARTA